MKSKPYRFGGKLFRYDFDNAIVECIAKASEEEQKDEAEWMEKHKTPLFGIDVDGYMVVTSIGLSRESWKNKAMRDELLEEWSCDIDFESEQLASDFEKYELPHHQKTQIKEENA